MQHAENTKCPRWTSFLFVKIWASENLFFEKQQWQPQKRDLSLNITHLLKRSSNYKHYLTQHCVKAVKWIAWNVLSTRQYVFKWRRCFISLSFEVFNSFNPVLEELLEKQNKCCSVLVFPSAFMLIV